MSEVFNGFLQFLHTDARMVPLSGMTPNMRQ